MQRISSEKHLISIQENHYTLVNYSTGLAIISVNQLSNKPAPCNCICTRHIFFYYIGM